MKIISTYSFVRNSNDPLTRFMLVNHSGDDFRDFPSTYVRGPETGKQYIILRDTQNSKLKVYFTHMLEWKSGKCLTGFNDLGNGYSIGNDKSLGMNHFILIHTDFNSFIELSFVNAEDYFTQRNCFETWSQELKENKE